MKPRFHTLKVKDIHRETEDAVAVTFLVPEDLKESYLYQPGQHLTFRRNIEEEEVRRSYSICTGLHENKLRIAVKQMPYGKFSTFMNQELKQDDFIEVMTPIGNFTTKIEEGTEKNFVFFAGGSGITPVMSLLKTILHTAKKSSVALIYGNRGFNHIIFREELSDIKNRYMDRFSVTHVFSDEKLGNKLQEGLLNKEKVNELYEEILEGGAVDDVFVCGPQPMILAVKDIFLERGFDEGDIHFELFKNPGQADKKAKKTKEEKQYIKEEGEKFKVTAIIDGEQINVDLARNGKVILDAINDVGADAPYSCKGGVCSTCKGKVLVGKVEMDQNYALEEDELKEGYVLTCQSHPITEKVVITYDE